MKELYDVITKKTIYFEEGQIEEKLKSLNIPYTNSYQVWRGISLHVYGRYILPENKDKIFTLVEKDTGIERDCIAGKSIFIYYDLQSTKSEIRHVNALFHRKQNFASICDRIFYLKTDKGMPKVTKMVKAQHIERQQVIKKKQIFEKKYTDEELLKQITDFYIKNNKIPIMTDLPNGKTITKRFKGFSNALNVAFRELLPTVKFTRRRGRIIEINCKNCQKTFSIKEHLTKGKNRYCSIPCSRVGSIKTRNQNFKGFKHRSKFELECEKRLSILYPEMEINYNRQGIIDYELDIYIPSLNLAIEINGACHYIKIAKKFNLERKQAIDREKIELCKKAYVDLYVLNTSKMQFPKDNDIYFNMIKNFIDTKLKTINN